MKRLVAFVTLSLIFGGTNTTFLKSSMLPPTIEEANYNQPYIKSVNSTTDYMFVYKKNKVRLLISSRYKSKPFLKQF